MIKNKIIKTAPDYIPLSFSSFIGRFFDLFSVKKRNIKIDYVNYSKILGFSCRSLFETFMMHFNKKEDLIIASTPFHHTSFRNIIERYVKPENIHIIDVNENYNEISEIPEMKKCDLVIITHLFGQDLKLNRLADFKKKHNCLIIEDRVQGGTYEKKFSDEIIDLSFHSMGMDKRPVALGGGFIHIRSKHNDLIAILKKTIEELPDERKFKRFVDLVKKFPTYFFYNRRFFLRILIGIIKIIDKIKHNLNMLKLANFYRKKNPGFSHNGYLLKPSNALLKSMYKNLDNYEEIEQRYTEKYSLFFSSMPPEVIAYFFPWYKGNAILTAYNTILIEERFVDQFLEFLTKHHIFCIANPTYKMFNKKYENDENDAHLVKGIVYLPSVANMDEEELIYLSNKIQEFYLMLENKKMKKIKKMKKTKKKSYNVEYV